MKKETVMKAYLNALGKGNYEDIIRLFSADAVVFSPLKGRVDAKKFYRNLLNDTAKSRLRVLDTLTGKKFNAIHFNYTWTLKNGKKTSFDCVDIFSFNKSNKIKKLVIIYDTHKVRESLS